MIYPQKLKNRIERMKWIFFKRRWKIEPCMCLKWHIIKIYFPQVQLKFQPCEKMCTPQWTWYVNGRKWLSLASKSLSHLFWQFVWFGSALVWPYLSDGKYFLVSHCFSSAYGVFLLLACFWDKLYRQPCLLLKYSAVSSVSHYCWWSFISWSEWKEFWHRAVEDT